MTSAAQHPRLRLVDELAHPVRFSITAALAGAEELEFAAVRDAVQISDSALSKQAAQLESAGLVRVRKGFIGKRPRTWLKLTTEGRARWEQHIAAIREIASV